MFAHSVVCTIVDLGYVTLIAGLNLNGSAQGTRETHGPSTTVHCLNVTLLFRD